MRDLSRGMMGLDICIKGKQNVYHLGRGNIYLL